VHEDGYYVYRGRRDDMLKVGGIYVSPCSRSKARLHPSRGAAARWSLAGGRADQAQGFVVLKSPWIRGSWRRRCRRSAKAALAPYNIHADRISHRTSKDGDRQARDFRTQRT
jgi:acyl-coenzyme A synthetase/AMP-(fatty) acid ligase